ncbi:MAG: VWA domain-containing protein [Terracidiphilus sp.]
MSKLCLHCLALSVLIAAVTFAQQNPVPALSPRPQPASTAAPAAGEGRIHLDVVVTDKSGKPVAGLGLNDFTLLDNGQPSKILSFTAINGTAQKADPPVEVILLLDMVNLPFSQVSITRQHIDRFLRQNSGHLAQPVSLFVLTDKSLDVQGQPSTDGSAQAEAFSQIGARLRSPGFESDSYGEIDRIQMSLKTLSAITNYEGGKPGRKLLIWVGPGWPLLDQPNIKRTAKGKQEDFQNIVEFSTRLREARVSVYSISFGQPNSRTVLYESFLKGVKTEDKAIPPDLGLKVLAVESSGRVLGPGGDLAAQIDSCIDDAQAYYRISFDPPPADGPNEYHDLKVQIDKPKLTARTNTGYYNQP